jgi:hypothetical protein
MVLLANKHPGVQANCEGDTSVYSNIIWIDTAIPQATLDAEYIEYYKVNKNILIDIKTQELISGGFTYNASIFSLSSKAQTNWIGLEQADALGLITFPYNVTTKDDLEHSIISSADLTGFYATGLGIKSAHISSGRDLKQLVNVATTIAEVDAVVDNR